MRAAREDAAVEVGARPRGGGAHGTLPPAPQQAEGRRAGRRGRTRPRRHAAPSATTSVERAEDRASAPDDGCLVIEACEPRRMSGQNRAAAGWFTAGLSNGPDARTYREAQQTALACRRRSTCRRATRRTP